MMKHMRKLLAASAAVAMGGALIAAGAPQAEKAQVGKPAPDFTLLDLDGKEHTLSSYTAQGNVVVLEWFNPLCPFVKKHYNHPSDTMNAMVKGWEGERVVYLRINSADPSTVTGNPETLRKGVQDFEITTPLLLDPTGVVGKRYGAKRTPEMYVITSEGVLAYHGAIDDDNTARAPGKTNYVKQAVDAVLAGKEVPTPTSTAYGCSIHYAE